MKASRPGHDPTQVENAILNLAINARDALRGRGRLTIEVGNASLDDDYALEFEIEPGPYVHLTVTDTGAGKPLDVIEQAFEPFFTTKPEGQGTGLGLSMVYGFVKQSGGHIKIYSELGHVFATGHSSVDGRDDHRELERAVILTKPYDDRSPACAIAKALKSI